MLAPRSLREASVQPSLLSNPSPGSLQPTRLAVNAAGSSCSAYFASGCLVYKIEVISSSVVDHCPHYSVIQSVVLAEGDHCLILGTVDSYGHLIVSRLDIVVDDIDRASYSVPPRDCGVGEGSWLGYVLVRCTNPRLWYPSLLSFAQCMPQVNESGSMLVIAEGSQLSISDLRMSNNGGCVQHISGPIGGIIYSVCSSSGLIAAGGTDGTVTIYDPHRWSALSRSVGCSKYEITCGLWKETERAFSFKGDSNWLCFSKCANTDVVTGWCESRSVFVADVKQDCISVIGW